MSGVQVLKTIFLYIILHDDNSSGERFRVQMPDMKTCIEAVESGKMPMPNKPSGDYEVMGVMFCGTGEFQRNFSANWYVDPVKQL
jgi:hypothetical protein